MPSITVGAAAIARPVNLTFGNTYVETNNPADGTGTITTFEFWAQVNLANCKAGTFSDDGSDKYTPRDFETIGAVTSGSKQTFSGLDCDVVSGDVAGAYHSAGNFEATAGSTAYYKAGDQFAAGQQTYASYGRGEFSLYATGWAHTIIPQWLSGEWAYRLPATIDNSVVDSNLTFFPTPLICASGLAGKNSTDISSIFDVLGSNWEKIAVTSNDGTTQLYVEKEDWDAVSEDFVLHVGATGASILASPVFDEKFFLYFDPDHADNTDYVGAVNTTPGATVWDGSFELVMHMENASAVSQKDSTSNSNDVVSVGGNPTESQTGEIGRAISFDGIDDSLNIADANSLDFGDVDFTVELWVNVGTDTGDEFLVKGTTYDNDAINYKIAQGSSKFFFGVADSSGTAGHYTSVSDGTDYTTGAWRYVVGRHLSAGSGTIELYTQGALQDSTTPLNNAPSGNLEQLRVADFAGSRFSHAIIDEVRISRTSRSADWIKACFYAQDDEFLTWGPVQRAIPRHPGVVYQDPGVL